MDSDRLYEIALSMTPGITAEIVSHLSSAGISAREFMTMNMPEISKILGTGIKHKFHNADRESAIIRARKEISFMDKHHITARFILNEDYPVLLREIPDAPVLIYTLGKADLNSQPILSVVGTRRCTQYGMKFCGQFIKDLSEYFPHATIVSGLAHGIDAAAHAGAIENSLPTIAVVAHGLDTIYPAANRDLAKRILERGGAIITEYPSGTRPYRNNFLQRNRIVAGLSEVTIVVESEIKGGAMSTANQAFSYSRDVVAVPGRYTDVTSQGCNTLISRNKASIYTCVADLMLQMRWNPIPGANIPQQRPLFPELEGDPKIIYDLLRREAKPLSIDYIHTSTTLPMPSLMAALTEMEFDGAIVKLPGARYELS